MGSLTKLLSVSFLLVVFSFLMCPEAFAQKKKKIPQEEPVVQQNEQEDKGIKGKEDYGNTASLVTSGTGKTKEEAINNALRSAIEQVFGTFVSSNTQILNDEVIKDEIVSISSGNVLGYEEISSDESQEGYNVLVKSVVSIGKLITYTESHGSSTELAGNTFLRNRDLAKLNKNNEWKAIIHMKKQLIPIVEKGLFDFSLDVSEPYGTGEWIKVGVGVKATPNENMKAFWDIVERTLFSLDMLPNEIENYKKIGFGTNPTLFLALDKQLNNDCSIGNIFSFYEERSPSIPIYLRNNYVLDLEHYLQWLIIFSRFSFEIYDNLGTLIYPALSKWDKKGEFYVAQRKHDVSFKLLGDAFFFDYLNNKKDPYIKTGFFCDASIYSVMEGMGFELYYSADSLSQLKNISIRHAVH